MKRALLLFLIGWMTVILVLTPLAVAPAAVLATASGPALSRQVLDIKKLPADLALASSADEKIKPLKKPAPQPPPPDAANKWAVVIGIADYSGRENDLWHPDEDANEMASYLVSRGFASERIKILLNRKATAAAIQSAIEWLKTNENSQSTVVFFYSGHGFRVADADGWDADAEGDGQDEGIVSYDLYGLPDGCFVKPWTVSKRRKWRSCSAPATPAAYSTITMICRPTAASSHRPAKRTSTAGTTSPWATRSGLSILSISAC